MLRIRIHRGIAVALLACLCVGAFTPSALARGRGSATIIIVVTTTPPPPAGISK